MLVVFFTIVFIAELIVAGWIISSLKKLSQKVNRINLTVNQLTPEIISTVSQIKSIVESVSTKINATTNFFEEKKCDCTKSIRNGLIASLIFSLTKLPGKKILTIIDLILTLRKLTKSIAKK